MEYYATGEKVFYKFGADSRWHGPGDIEDENDTGSEGEENEFRQIRTKFLSFPFQAIECYLANWSEKEVNKKIYRTGAGHPKKGEKDRRKKENGD